MDPAEYQAWQLEQFVNLLAKIGMVTVCGLILTPVPSFLFCGLTQKEKEARIQSFSFSYLLFSLLNNLIWLAYSQKVDDLNIGIPAVLGCFVGVTLISLYLSVKSNRQQVIACFILISISEFFFSSVIPAFITGSVASFLSISTYFSTLGQIPLVIRERDHRYIALPLVLISLVNASIWTLYSIIKNDIPLFATNAVAFFFMLINLTFYLWALDIIPTERISTLITIFKIAFPDNEVDLNKELGLDNPETLDPEQLIAAKEQYFKQQNKEFGIDNPSETTRLTQSGDSMRETMASMSNPYLYTETYGEESKSVVVRPPEQRAENESCGRRNNDSLFLFDESTIADISQNDLNLTRNSIKSETKPQEDEESQQSGAKINAPKSPANQDSGNQKTKHEVITEDDSCFDFQIEEQHDQN